MPSIAPDMSTIRSSNNRSPSESIVHVAVAVIRNENNEILIQQRAANTHQGGLWEFPGGKLEEGETVEQGLIREIKEELDIQVLLSRPLIKIQHDYGDRHVLLDVHFIEQWQGQVIANESQPLKWVAPEALINYSMPAADKPIVSAIQLPSHYVITPSKIEQPEAVLNRLEQLLNQEEKLFLYRVKSLQGMTHEELIQEFLERCDNFGAKLILHEQNKVNLPVHGIHLTESGLAQATDFDASKGLISASCHSLESLLKAQTIGASFAMLSPVMETQSHPGEPALGWQAFEEIVDRVNIPVYALGGMSPGHIKDSYKFGAQGIAAISHFWKDL